jgi:hypothetical protein
MAKIDYNIFEIEPIGLTGFRSLSTEDVSLISSAQISKTFKPNDNFIELSFYALDNVRLQTISSYTNYSILSGDTKQGQEGTSEIGIDVIQDYISYGFQGQEVKALYNFLDYPYSNTLNPQDFYIESISPDRTEVRLLSVNLGGSEVLDTTNKLIDSFNNETYTPDLYLYFGNNIFFSIVNIDVEEFRDTNAVLIKLYTPLPSTVNTKSRLNIVEKVSNSIAFEINTIITPDKPVIPTLRGANFNVEVEEQSTEPSQYYNYTELFSFPTNNTYRELNSLFKEKGAELGIDYSEFSNFINFSSAEERLLNFKYKLDLINSYQSSLDNITSINYADTGITGSRVYYENLLNGVVNNFDHYEKHLYFESGSTSWPKSNFTKPYINQQSSDTEATNWYLTELEDAILFDAQNPDILTNTVPSYLKEDPDNRPYELFIHMIAQHFDNLWVYTDAVSKKYDNDNRLNRGVSKDLVEDLLKNFGIKLYTSNKSVEDLFRYFTVNSYDTGEEYLPTGIITSGQPPTSQNDYQKEIYKRIYHNLPLLMKSKGTERGLRALINCFGIPSDVLKIKIFGGQSANDLPFFGGEQAWTGSLDKVRLNNTGSITSGDTISFYTSIINPSNEYTQDLHRIEVGFSPADNINTYILSQSAVLFPNDPFNIDDYIGDPREVTTNTYAALRTYADQIFENVGFYNLKDFVRLIKFFDNVIFRMVRDFVPARSVTDAGIIIKPHLLERSKYGSPVMTWTRPEYSGSIDTAFISGSSGGAYKNIGVGSIGTLFNKESSTRRNYTVPTPLGKRGKDDKLHQEPRYNGELYNSYIKVTNGELNSSNPFKNLEYPTVAYKVQFYNDPPANLCLLELSNLSQFIIDPLLPGSGIFSNYDLGNLFPGSSGTYDYIVSTNGSTETLTGTNVNYNFLQGNNWEQYQVFDVTTFHQDNNSLFGGSCTNDREVKIVACNLVSIPANIPSTVVPLQFYNLNTWWNSGTSPNTDISYDINGTTYTPAEVTNFVFSETLFTNGQTITVTVKENNNPTGCKLEMETIFSNCTITIIDTPQWTNPENQYTFPYNFGGVLENITTFSFRLEWCGNAGNFGFCVNADYNGVWVDIDPNNLVESGELPYVLEQYPAANQMNFNDTIVPPEYSYFTQIQTWLDNPFVNQGFIRMRFRAQNSAGCVLPHTQTVILSAPGNPPPVYEFTIPYNTDVPKACCEGPTTQTVYTNATSIDQLLYTNIIGPLPTPPSIFANNELNTYAPSGWYTDGVVARRWQGEFGFWLGALNNPPSNQETSYIVCNNNIHVELNSCP